MGQQGWVSIHRKIKECWIWTDKEPFDKRSAWIDLLLSANYTSRKILIGSKLVEVQKGQFITSELKLAERWHWDRKTVRRFLKILEDDEMISKKVEPNKYTMIEIKNFERYQNSENEGTTQNIENKGFGDNEGTTQGTTEGQQRDNTRDTNNNDNNSNNVNKLYLSDSNEYRLAEYLYRYMLKNNHKCKEPNFQSWSKHFDYILRIDKRDIEEVKAVIKFSQTDSFWSTNILSPVKLRDKFDQLLLKMKQTQPIKSKQEQQVQPKCKTVD